MGRFRKVVAVAAAAAVLAGAGVLIEESPAAATKVANPGSTFALRFASGTLNIGDNSFDFVDEGREPQCSDGINNDGSGADAQDTLIDYPADPQCSSATDDSETQPGFQAKLPIQLNNGTLDAAGNVTWPAANVFFPPQYLFVNADDASGGVVSDFIVTLQISAIAPWTGHVNPINGAMDIRMQVKVSATGGPLSNNCQVNPIDINPMVTGTATGPGPKAPLTGVPLDTTTGRGTMVNTNYSVPGASNCGTVALFYNLNDAINEQLGLPSPAGNNDATFTGVFTPNIPQPAVVASFTATPSSGPAPLNVNFNAGASVGTGKTYQWDLDGNGAFDAGVTQVNPSFSYLTAGNRTVKLRVTDSGGDFAETTRLVTVGANQPPIPNSQTVTTPEDVAVAVTLSATDPEGGPITYARTTPNPANGTATCTASGACTYTPNPNFHGTDTFGFRVTDNFSPPNSANGVVTVNVTPVNDAPTAANVSATIVEDTPGTVNLLGNDIDGDPLTYNVIAPPTKGTLSGTGPSLTYTPNLNAVGADSFTYDVTDPSGAHSNVATASITIAPVNDAPVANPQAVATSEDTPLPITLTGSDVDGDTITYGLVVLPTLGSLSGTLPNLTYTPAANANGNDSFTFKVTDPSGASSNAVVSITINPVNDAPTAANASVGTAQDVPVTINIVANDVDGDALTFVATDGANGTVSCTGNACTYTPDSGFAGTDSFTVTVSDPDGLAAVSTVSVAVSAVNNHAPVLNDATVAVLEDTPRNFAVPSTDVDGDPRTYTVLVAPASGSLTCSPTGSCSYTPAPNVFGNQTFVIEVSDGRGGVDQATITLAIAGVNDAPSVPPGQNIVTAEDNLATLDLVATDADGDTITWVVKRAPLKGSLTCTSAGACTYMPNHNANGPDSFEVEASDGNGGRVRITVPVTITPIDDPPVAGVVSKVVAEDSGPSSFNLSGSDPDGGPVTFAASPATLGTLTCSNAGACTFVPAANAFGTETIGYTVTDSGGSSGGTIVITISPVNDPPVAGNLTLGTMEDTPVSFTLPAADADPGDPLTFTLTGAPAMGWVSGSAPNLTFTPSRDASGTVTFGYSVRDLAGAVSNGTVTITVFPVDDFPVANSASVTTPEDTAKAIALTGSDAEGPVTITVTTPPTHGTYSIGSGVYTPALNYNGPDSIGFAVKDNANQVTNGTIAITVTPVNDPPVASDAAVSTTRTVPIPITLGGTDPDGPGTLTFAIVSAPTKGTLSGTAPNLTYTPTGFNTGNDAFTFSVTDSGGLTDSGTVTVTIAAGPALATKQVVSPATVTKPGGLLGFLQNYQYTNLKTTLTTVGSNLPVSGITVTFSVSGTAICSATTNASGVATCNGSGPRVDSSTYTATSTATASFASSTGTGSLS